METLITKSRESETILKVELCIIADKFKSDIKKKIEFKGTKIKDWDLTIYYGIKTGLNDAFIIDKESKEELISLDPGNIEIIKPVLRGKDIKRYTAIFADLWLIITHNGYKNNEGIKIPRIDVEQNYPIIKKHLNKYWDKLSIRKDQGFTPYNLRNCAYMEEFKKEKITWGNLAQSPQFTIVEEDVFINAPSPMITPANKYILAVLNSKICNFYLSFIGIERSGGFYEYKPMYIEQMPIPVISESLQEPFYKLVDEILNHKKKGIETNYLENKIDQMVYELFELTKDEVELIENF